jgi:3-hydroxyacyl-[acyl-carrier-protein] dehydratase
MAAADARQTGLIAMNANAINPHVGQTTAGDETFEHAFRIGADHPSLPGHFPGHPLVPGVIVLEQVAIALHAWRGQRLARVVEAKFVSPLLPDEEALVRLALSSAERIRFEVFRGDTLLARGSLEAAA